MDSRRLSAAGLRFLDHPWPTGELRLAYARRTDGGGRRQTPLGLPCSALASDDWGGHSLYSGVAVSIHEPRVLLMALPEGISFGV